MSTIGVSAIFDILRIVFGSAFLFYASFTDLKERRVRDQVWILMGFTGGIFLALQMFLQEKSWEHFLIFVPLSIIFLSMFVEFNPVVDRENKTYDLKPVLLWIAGFLALLYQSLALWGSVYFYQLLTIPLMILVFYAFYQLNILHGGADAKALMTLAVFVPFYPEFPGFPLLRVGPENVSSALELLFPFAFLILMNSVIVVIWIFLGLLVFNLARRDIRFPEMLLGYTMDLDDVEGKFVWPMEKVEDGKRTRVLVPRGSEKPDMGPFRELGISRIWVTPKIPFIIAITGGFFLSTFIGNLFMAAMGGGA